MAGDDLTTDELQRAWRQCKLIGISFAQAMANPTLAICIRRVAYCNRRKPEAPARPRRFDHKLAQANDID